ncbi:MAG: phage tail tape measure protein [Candidatus Promineofilum sp.]|uniref:phage tail tape measure protein n=1 Tax=Promineifilum sp. TaxID=2664178 RepID=UPI002411D56A|nr:phage tail tape measure protein [Promineifilum sp.]
MAAELAIIAKLQDEASSGIRALRGEIEGVGESGGIAAKGFQSLQTVGAVALTALAGAVTLAAGATALFVKSAISAGIEFESAFAGVIKTVDGVVDAGGNPSPPSARNCARASGNWRWRSPVAVTELAKIGELGGQLGVAGEDLIDFTRLIAQLGVTTNLSVEEAAMSFAQFATSCNRARTTWRGSVRPWSGWVTISPPLKRILWRFPPESPARAPSPG